MNRNLLLVTLSLGIWGVGEGFFIYFQPLYLQEWGADPLMIGGVYGMMGFANAISQIPAGYLSDRFGSRSIMWGSWILGTLAAWTMALAPSLPFFVVGVVLYGLTGFVLAPMNSYLTHMRGSLSVGRAVSIPSAAFNLGAVLGPVIGGMVAEHLGFRIVYLIAAVIFVFSTAMVLFVQKQEGVHEADQNSNNRVGLLGNARFLVFLALSFVTLFALYLPQPLTPNFLQNQQHLTSTAIGILGAVASLGSALAMFFLSHLNVFAGFLISQVFLLLSSALFFHGRSVVLFGFAYLFVGGYRLCRAMNLAITREMIHPSQTGLAYGAVETMNGLSVILAPLLAGFLYRNDPYSVYQVSMILLVSVLVLNAIVLSFMNPRKARQV